MESHDIKWNLVFLLRSQANNVALTLPPIEDTFDMLQINESLYSEILYFTYLKLRNQIQYKS